MPNILQTIADHNRALVAAAKERVSAEEMAARARALGPGRGDEFVRALAAPGLSFICECKSASPSAGVIRADYDPEGIGAGYERAGADAISCLTEPKWFHGSMVHLEGVVAAAPDTPVLRKDFVVDTYQIYEARVAGAAAVLLLCGILDDDELGVCLDTCHELGLAALVEAYDAEEVRRAVASGARVIGANNRNLRDFAVDFGRASAMCEMVPPDRVFVAESGISSLDDVAAVAASGADAALVGEFLMRADDRVARLASMRATARTKAPARSRRALVKCCGLTSEADVALANAALPDYVGFVIDVPGRARSLTPDRAAQLAALVDTRIRRVGVFVDGDLSTVARLLREHVIDVAQLHGDEDDSYVRALREQAPGCTIWQAHVVRDATDVAAARASQADLVLLDAGRGEGRRFDWDLAEAIGRPFALAGGLDATNVADACRTLAPAVVDVSSGVETNGAKDADKLQALIAQVRGIAGISPIAPREA